MISVCHLVPSMQSGGVEQVVLELCAGLGERGLRNVVISGGGALVETVEATGACHVTRPIGRKSLATLREVLWLRRYLAEEKPDILHVHSRVPAWVARLSCALLPPLSRPRVVSSFHGFHSVNKYSAIMTHGDHVIAVSECMREHILECYPSTPDEKITVIPNSIDLDEHNQAFKPSEEWLDRWRSLHPELQGKMVLCLPGRITRLKGAEDLIPLLSELRRLHQPAHALIVGECKKGKEAYKQELVSLFEAAGLSSSVSWLGHREDLREIFYVSDAVLSLSHQPESFGKTTLEALALGRPVAGYAYGGVEELLKLFLPEGMVEPGDTTTMALRLSRWYQHEPPPLQTVASPFRREDMVSAHHHLYMTLLNS